MPYITSRVRYTVCQPAMLHVYSIDSVDVEPKGVPYSSSVGTDDIIIFSCKAKLDTRTWPHNSHMGRLSRLSRPYQCQKFQGKNLSW